MATKLRAYYWLEESKSWKCISRWDILKMDKAEYSCFRSEHDFHIMPNKQSAKLTFNRLQRTFRYFPHEGENDEGVVGMSISHLLAEEVICDLDVLKLKLTDKRMKKFKQYDIELKSTNRFSEFIVEQGNEKYIFDTRIFFNSPEELSLKWGGKVNIEVYVTSAVKRQKIEYCERNKEALIEVKLSEKLISRHKVSEVTQEMEEQIRTHIQRAFAKQIYANLLVSPVSDQYLTNKIVNEKNNRIAVLERENLKLHTKIEELKNKNKQGYINKFKEIFLKKDK